VVSVVNSCESEQFCSFHVVRKTDQKNPGAEAVPLHRTIPFKERNGSFFAPCVSSSSVTRDAQNRRTHINTPPS